jgi:hypothetical protein
MHGNKPVKHVSQRKNVSKRTEGNKISGNSSQVDTYLSFVSPDSTVKKCNSFLMKLENNNDGGILNFLDWMRSHGKLKRNADAYQLALRVVARRELWHKAKELLEEMVSISECELNVKII